MKFHGRLDILVNNSGRQRLCDKLDDIDLGEASRSALPTHLEQFFPDVTIFLI
jgi:NAD(P)-dependent dehydrogenase (short-subunit alcohol dehydrogenase family)